VPDPVESAWTTAQMPDQTGRRVIVTGASSGLGEVTARELARRGAEVVLAVRNLDKGATSAARIRSVVPDARVEVRELDLSSLESVRTFAVGLVAVWPTVDVLVNNAGIMQTPPTRTADGYELQLSTNHLGHFALTGLLLEALGKGSSPRVVVVASNEHKGGHLDFDNLQLDRDYAPRKSYQRSKLANVLFGLELDRRLRAAGSPIICALAHPGYSATNLQSTGPTGFLTGLGFRLGNAVFAQPAERGALPQLFAATAPEVEGGQYFGPDGFMEMRGRHPVVVRASSEARDPEVARRLWTVSEELTGVTFPLPVPTG
jgi:NAD(P)-dependent dehydrogenase (short-subunit alcohol dehydrogenase family)